MLQSWWVLALVWSATPGAAATPPPRHAARRFSSQDPTHSFPKDGHGLARTFRLLAPTLQARAALRIPAALAGARLIALHATHGRPCRMCRTHNSRFRPPPPALQELCVAHCSDIFHAKSFADVAQLQVGAAAAAPPPPLPACSACLLRLPARRMAHLCLHLQYIIRVRVLPSAQNLESLAVTFMAGRINPADLAPLEGLRRLRSLTLSASRHAGRAAPGGAGWAA